MKKVVNVLLLLLVGVVVLSGCNSASDTNADGDTPLVVAQGVDPTTLDPGMHAETTTGNVERQIFDCLIDRDNDMNFQPSLATSWEPTDDFTWEIKLQDGVKFHDGNEMTAEDVKFSLERILDADNHSPQLPNFKAINSVEIVDEYTIEIKTHNPYPILPARLANLRVVPKHYVEEVGPEKFTLEPIGTGPYKLVEWVKDDRITLEANEEYWRGAPDIKEVVFKPIPEATSRVMALQVGEADIIVNVPPHQEGSITKDNISAAKVPSSRMVYISLVPKEGAPMADVRVRKAVNYAVDVQTIIDTILEGNAQESTQALSSMDFGYNQEIDAYGYDPDKARELLAEAGYPEGLSLDLMSPNGRYMMDKEVAEAVKSQLKDVGINVNLQVQEWGVYVDKIMSHSIDADMWMIGWGNSTFDADNTLYPWFHSEQAYFYYDVGQQRNDRMDQLLSDARTTLDTNLREQLYHEALQMVHDDAAWITLYQQTDIYGVSNRVQWEPRSDEAIIIYDASWSR